jgi:hypothetical protein
MKHQRSIKPVVTILKKGDDSADIAYWRSLAYEQRIANLTANRQMVISETFGAHAGLQWVCRIVRRTKALDPAHGIE